MPRAVLLGIAVPVLAAACALVSPQPPGTRPIQLNVRNNTGAPVEVRVAMAGGSAAGPAVPPMVPIGGLGTPVTIYVPISGHWTVDVGQATLMRQDFEDLTAPGCTFGVELDLGGGYSFGCHSDL
jgi:hypothetical protein